LRGDGDRQRRSAVILTRARIAVAAGDPSAALSFARGAFELADRGPNALESATLQFEVAAVMQAVAAVLPPAEADEARNVGRSAARAARSLESVRDYSFLHRTHAEAVKAAHALLAIGDQPAATLRIHLFGAMRVTRDAVDVEAGAWKRRKAREILAYLVLERGRLVPRARLVDVFWPEADADAASDNLRVAVSAIRRAVGNVIRFENGGYRFDAPAGTTVDLDRFDGSLALARRLREPAAICTAYAEALEVYSGDLLDGFEDANWHLHERTRLRDGALEAARALVANPDATAAARSRALDRFLALAPFDPEAMRARLDVLAAAKRVGEARAEYERWRRRYAEALGEAPPEIWHPPRLAVVPSTG
jgi:DNA-binding SARP family transcriptional activator